MNMAQEEESIMNNCKFNNSVEKWDVFEVTVNGFSDKNPFVDYSIKGVFIGKMKL